MDGKSGFESKLKEMCAQLKKAKEFKKELEEKLKQTEAIIQNLSSSVIPKMMEDAEIPKVTFEGIGTVYLANLVRVSVLAEDKPAFMQFLRETGQQDIIKEDVPWQTLSKWGKEVLENGQALPEICKVFIQPTARILNV